METYNASVTNDESNHYLELDIKEKVLKIPLTKDLPNVVKDVFNELILRLKREHFRFELSETESDLFSQVSKEYIDQLNSELSAVYEELKHHNLLIETDLDINTLIK